MDDPFESTPWPPGATREEIIALMLADIHRFIAWQLEMPWDEVSAAWLELARGYTTQPVRYRHPDERVDKLLAAASRLAGLPGTEESPSARPEPPA